MCFYLKSALLSASVKPQNIALDLQQAENLSPLAWKKKTTTKLVLFLHWTSEAGMCLQHQAGLSVLLLTPQCGSVLTGFSEGAWTVGMGTCEKVWVWELPWQRGGWYRVICLLGVLLLLQSLLLRCGHSQLKPSACRGQCSNHFLNFTEKKLGIRSRLTVLMRSQCDPEEWFHNLTLLIN